MSKVLKNNFVIIFIAFVSFFTALNANNNPFRVGNTGTDSSVFNYIAQVIIDGGMPYRDTFDHKGPVIYLIDALGLLINRKTGVWIIELLTLFIILLMSYNIAKLLGCQKKYACINVVLTAIGLTYYYDGGNLTEEYACAFLMTALFVFVKFF